MNKKDEIVGYIERSIVDIARKCDVKSTDVINYFKELLKTKEQ